jgi:hypothetical protein
MRYRLKMFMAGLAVADAGHFELCAVILAGHGREQDFLGAQRAFFRCVHYYNLIHGRLGILLKFQTLTLSNSTIAVELPSDHARIPILVPTFPAAEFPYDTGTLLI